MKNLIILIIVAIVLINVVVFIFSRDTAEAPVLSPSSILTPPILSPTELEEQNRESSISQPSQNGSGKIGIITSQKATVTYSDSGYSPATIIVKRGDMVVFDNKGPFSMWTASAVHPTHEAYPGSGIGLCGTNTLVAIFDACGGYGPGESWKFKFNERGTWKYHNHMQANHTGTIIVE
ncbi:MAG: hypothetical protein HY505_03010 [Candidatus Yanofskybacteria bacterium]|nr:hypothetical protein [Candidatus Yanofskybacteria bacterium]